MRKVISIALLGFVLICSRDACGGEKDMIIDARADFSAAKAEVDRLNVAIAVMNDGLIRKWSSVGVVDAIFGSKFDSERELMRSGETTWGIIDFSKQPESSSDDRSAARTGWYLAVKYDSNGVIHDYHLSNSHK